MNRIFSAFRLRSTPGQRRLLVSICLALIVAVSFTAGIEAFGQHDHGNDGEHADRTGSTCIVCRVLDNPSSITAPAVGLVSAPPPDKAAGVSTGTSEIVSSPAHATPFLRGPPAA